VDIRTGRFSEEQIVGTVREHEAERKIAELVPEYRRQPGNPYRWPSTYVCKGFIGQQTCWP